MSQSPLATATLPPLNELMPSWLLHCQAHRETLADQCLNEELAQTSPTSLSEGTVVSIESQINQSLLSTFKDQTIEFCLSWLTTDPLNTSNPLSLSDTDLQYMKHQIGESLEDMPSMQVIPPTPITTVSSSRWAFIAMIGAVIGMLFLAPLSQGLLNQHALGLFFGALLGSGGLVAWVNQLTQDGQTQTSHEKSSTESQKKTPSFFKRFIRSTLIHLLKPQISWPGGNFSQLVKSQVNIAVQQRFEYLLSICYFEIVRQKNQTTPSKETQTSSSNPLPDSVYQALADLYLDFKQTSNSSEDHFLDAIDVLFQRFEDSRYQWVFVENGTPFSQSFENQFDTLGLIKENTEVKTRRPALLIDNKVIFKGELRKTNKK